MSSLPHFCCYKINFWVENGIVWVLIGLGSNGEEPHNGPLPSLSYPVPWALRQHCLYQATRPNMATPALDPDHLHRRAKINPRVQKGTLATCSRDFTSHPSLPSPQDFIKTTTQINELGYRPKLLCISVEARKYLKGGVYSGKSAQPGANGAWRRRGWEGMLCNSFHQ